MDDQGTNREVEYDEWLIAAEKLLRSKSLHWSHYTQPSADWDHDHCHFCFRRFAEPHAGYNDAIEVGYTTPDRANWICSECVGKYKDRFDWMIEAIDGEEKT